jgi:hypothetical protein
MRHFARHYWGRPPVTPCHHRYTHQPALQLALFYRDHVQTYSCIALVPYFANPFISWNSSSIYNVQLHVLITFVHSLFCLMWLCYNVILQFWWFLLNSSLLQKSLTGLWSNYTVTCCFLCRYAVCRCVVYILCGLCTGVLCAGVLCAGLLCSGVQVCRCAVCWCVVYIVWGCGCMCLYRVGQN